jgi:hypothetical protein
MAINMVTWIIRARWFVAAVILCRPAGITSTLFVAPLDTLRTRMAHQGGRYRNIVDAARQTVADGGVLSLYRVRSLLP